MPNTKLTPGIISTLAQMLQTRVLPELYKKVREFQGDASAIAFSDELGRGIGSLMKATSLLNNGKGYSDTKPPYPDRYYAGNEWQDLIHEELLKFNSSGVYCLTSISECLIKTMGLINVHQNSQKRTLAYYRGQVNAEWDITSSIGRNIPHDAIPEDRSKVSQFELEAMEKWQSKVVSDDELINDIFSGADHFELDDPRWWGLKQHYDDDPLTGGSRLIDWTSSPLCGLYFACVNWDGSVDESVDGGLYVMMSGVGRMFASEDYISQLKEYEDEWHDKSGSSVKDYFSISDHFDYPRTVLTESENSRQVAQDGHFIFSPEFEKPITKWTGSKPFFFVIPKTSKKDILRELYSLGYTPKKILRGKKSIDAQSQLQDELGIID